MHLKPRKSHLCCSPALVPLPATNKESIVPPWPCFLEPTLAKCYGMFPAFCAFHCSKLFHCLIPAQPSVGRVPTGPRADAAAAVSERGKRFSPAPRYFHPMTALHLASGGPKRCRLAHRPPERAREGLPRRASRPRVALCRHRGRLPLNARGRGPRGKGFSCRRGPTQATVSTTNTP